MNKEFSASTNQIVWDNLDKEQQGLPQNFKQLLRICLEKGQSFSDLGEILGKPAHIVEFYLNAPFFPETREECREVCKSLFDGLCQSGRRIFWDLKSDEQRAHADEERLGRELQKSRLAMA